MGLCLHCPLYLSDMMRNEAHGYLQKTTKIHHQLRGFPNAKRSSNVTNPTVTFDRVFWVNLTFSYGGVRKFTYSSSHSTTYSFTLSFARVEKRTGEYFCPSGLGRVFCATCFVTRTTIAMVELTPNKPATTQDAKAEIFY